jgi:hypothetical protein
MADTKFTTLESQITVLLRTVAAINKAIEEEYEVGNYTAAGVTYDDEDSDYSAYSGSSRSSATASVASAASESEDGAKFLSIDPIVKFFIRESGIGGSWEAPKDS